jgi:biopolymer transport protein ExbB
MQGLIDWFAKGGVFMYPLLFCAVLGFAYLIERIITHARLRVDPQDFAEELIDVFKKDGASTAIEYCLQFPSPAAHVLRAAIERYKEMDKKSKDIREELEDVMTRFATRELAFLDRGMLIIGAICTVAPLIGFLGTVSGMIHAFDAIALAGTVEATLVASGISEALITTEAGLIIAVPLALGHALFTQKTNAFTDSMEEAAAALTDVLVEA